MSVLSVRNLAKTYSGFHLNNITFSLEEGAITGFIGRNGAGKSTTLNSLFNFVHPDSGEICFFNLPFEKHEMEIKQRVGYVSSGIDYYPKKKIKVISEITKSFYDNWDDTAYRKFMQMFDLDESKTPSELSAGMKVKYALALALSHNADLLVLDEPTSGLDPVSRDDLLDVFLDLCDRGKTLLFSTHITSDLDKCAKSIIYIKKGSIVADTTIKDFEATYCIVPFDNRDDMKSYEKIIVGHKRVKDGYTALIRTDDANSSGLNASKAGLEAIMIHLEKEDE